MFQDTAQTKSDPRELMQKTALDFANRNFSEINKLATAEPSVQSSTKLSQELAKIVGLSPDSTLQVRVWGGVPGRVNIFVQEPLGKRYEFDVDIQNGQFRFADLKDYPHTQGKNPRTLTAQETLKVHLEYHGVMYKDGIDMSKDLALSVGLPSAAGCKVEVKPGEKGGTYIVSMLLNDKPALSAEIKEKPDMTFDVSGIKINK